MKKHNLKKIFLILTISTVLLTAAVFTACKQLLDDPEEFLEYWLSEVIPAGFDIDKPVKTIGGVTCVSSAEDVRVNVKLQNPKNFKLFTPASSIDAGKVISFPGLSTQPVYGTDYTLKQTANDKLEITYKSVFLQQHEWGKDAVGAEITLISEDGRKFKKKFKFNLKVNTPPPKPSAVLAETISSPANYVLCLQIPDMDLAVPGGLLHKDIAQIEINGTSYPLTVSGGNFVKPADPHFIEYSAVKQLSESGAAYVPSGNRVLYYNTGLAVGQPYRAYTISLKDNQGLVSETLETGTALPVPPPETISITIGEQGTGSGISAADPVIIKGTAGTPEARIQIANSGTGTTVHCTVTDIAEDTTIRYKANPVIAPLSLKGGNERLYKVEYYTDGTGYTSSPSKTVYYKVLKQYPVTFSVEGGNGTLTAQISGNSPTSASPIQVPYGENVTFVAQPNSGWEVEKWTVNGTQVTGNTTYVLNNVTAAATLKVKFKQSQVTINGTDPNAWGKLKAAVEGGTVQVIIISGTIKAPNGSTKIEVKRTVTVEGENESTDILNADEKCLIFDVWNNGDLTLKKLTLKKGKNEGATFGGGAIYCGGGTVTVGNVTITDCKADKGGGIYMNGGTFNMKNNSVIGGQVSTDGNKAVGGSGGGVYMAGGTFNMTSGIIKYNSSKDGAGVYIKKGAFIMNGSILQNQAESGGKGSGIYLENDASASLTMNKSASVSTTMSPKNDIYLKSGAKITLTEAFSSADTAACITPESLYDEGRQVLDEAIMLGDPQNYKKFEVTPEPKDGNTINWTIDNQGKLKKVGILITGTDENPWKKLKTAVGAANDGDTIVISGEIKATDLAGNNGEILIKKKLTIQGKTGKTTDILNANKDTNGKSKHRIFIVKISDPNKSLTLENLTLKGGMAYKNGGAIMTTSSIINIANCTITKNTAMDYGGAIMSDGSIINIANCTITENTAKEGGGMYMKNTTRFTMESGEIKNNTSTSKGGGVFVYNHGTFTMNGGEISGNSGTEGGGVFVADVMSTFPPLKMKGSAKINTDNEIYLSNGKTITIVGTLTPADGIAGRITVPAGNYQPTTQVLTGSDALLNSEHNKFTVTPKDDQQWKIDNRGYLQQR
ncbi:right-handed parallel beta-helix repeat-containing protein [Treponema sp. OMZ 788]|uniref:right-handed parallel beta-helix repeat-containing protein n=1 Tax=Treponema sp. OMZ 788 TaxID=2563664 RepID=UPI0020A5264A|nr:right-handed parallel beta-helix repeat-containing protein [Treponema sp. OMZ 788]UTC63667.1 right-handed parallel beta-helix repeat-containing protein [Treponema sp. OMZ 788]